MAQKSPRMSMNTPSTTQQRENACRRLWYEARKAVEPPVTMRKAPMKMAPWCREGILLQDQNCFRGLPSRLWEAGQCHEQAECPPHKLQRGPKYQRQKMILSYCSHHFLLFRTGPRIQVWSLHSVDSPHQWKKSVQVFWSITKSKKKIKTSQVLDEQQATVEELCLSPRQMDERTTEPIKKSLLAPHPPSD